MCEQCCDGFEKLDQLHKELETVKKSLDRQMNKISKRNRRGSKSFLSLLKGPDTFEELSFGGSTIGNENISQALIFLNQICNNNRGTPSSSSHQNQSEFPPTPPKDGGDPQGTNEESVSPSKTSPSTSIGIQSSSAPVENTPPPSHNSNCAEAPPTSENPAMGMDKENVEYQMAYLGSMGLGKDVPINPGENVDLSLFHPIASNLLVSSNNSSFLQNISTPPDGSVHDGRQHQITDDSTSSSIKIPTTLKSPPEQPSWETSQVTSNIVASQESHLPDPAMANSDSLTKSKFYDEGSSANKSLEPTAKSCISECNTEPSPLEARIGIEVDTGNGEHDAQVEPLEHEREETDHLVQITGETCNSSANLHQVQASSTDSVIPLNCISSAPTPSDDGSVSEQDHIFEESAHPEQTNGDTSRKIPVGDVAPQESKSQLDFPPDPVNPEPATKFEVKEESSDILVDAAEPTSDSSTSESSQEAPPTNTPLEENVIMEVDIENAEYHHQVVKFDYEDDSDHLILTPNSNVPSSTRNSRQGSSNNSPCTLNCSVVITPLPKSSVHKQIHDQKTENSSSVEPEKDQNPISIKTAPQLLPDKSPAENRKRRDDEASKKLHTCAICGWWFAHTPNSKSHMRTHTLEKPYECLFCDKKCARQDDRQSHYRTHIGERPYQCKFCRKTFLQLTTYKGHVKNCRLRDSLPFLHSIKPDPETTSKFQKQALSSSSKLTPCRRRLPRRLTTKTGQRKRPRTISEDEAFKKKHTCQVCGKYLVNASGMKDHLNMHTGEKPYECVFCNKKIRRQKDLHIHLQTHIKEQLYQCKICKREFVIKSKHLEKCPYLFD